MFTRKDFLTGGVAMAAMKSVCGGRGDTVMPGRNLALALPDVTFKDL